MTKPDHTLWQQLILRAKAMHRGAGRYEHWTLMILALGVGLVAGLAAIGFYLVIGWLQETMFGSSELTLKSVVETLDWWVVLLVPVVGGVIVGQLIRFMPHHRAHGVPNVIESAALHDGRINLKHGLLSALISSVSIGFGASVGREGPVVHLGATLASYVTKRFHLAPAVARTLLGCGVAAAVSASFNAPIAGVFFAHEVIIGHYALHAFTPVVIAAIAGTLISRAFLGDYPAFVVPDYTIQSFWEFPAFFLLGIFAALIAVVFMHGLKEADKRRQNEPGSLPIWVLPIRGGVFVGLIAIVFPEILGVGYEATSDALNGHIGFWLLIGLVAMKIIATCISLGSHFGGGVFSPSLFIGAMAGGAFGIMATGLAPDLGSSAGVYAIVGMGAMASAVLGAPISSTLIVFEITGDYSLTIAVMIAGAVASLVTSLFYKRSFFHMSLANRGIHLEDGKASYLLKSMKVSEIMSEKFYTIDEGASLTSAHNLLVRSGDGKLIVIDEEGVMTGVITIDGLPADIFEEQDEKTLTAKDVAREKPLWVKSSEALQVVLNRMEQSGEDFLPVVENSSKPIVIGMLSYRAVMGAYNRALIETHGRDGKYSRVG